MCTASNTLHTYHTSHSLIKLNKWTATHPVNYTHPPLSSHLLSTLHFLPIILSLFIFIYAINLFLRSFLFITLFLLHPLSAECREREEQGARCWSACSARRQSGELQERLTEPAIEGTLLTPMHCLCTVLPALLLRHTLCWQDSTFTLRLLCPSRSLLIETTLELL